MKILMVSVHFNLPGDTIPVGGVQKHISKITEELRKRGNEVNWCYPMEAKKIISDVKPDIIISHDFFSFVLDVTIPQILVYHGWEGQVPPNSVIVTRRQELEKLASKTICIGQYIKKWYGQNPDLILHGGTDRVNIAPLPRQNKICYVGRLERDLSPQIFFEAMRMTELNYHLEVLGDGTLRCQLEEFAKKLCINVSFRGFVNNVDDYLKQSDIVFTSGYLSILEAYANQRPVISVCDNPLKEDYLQLMLSSPFVYKTPGEVAKMVDYLYTKGPGETLQLNYNFAMDNTWDKVVDKYEKLIREVI